MTRRAQLVDLGRMLKITATVGLLIALGEASTTHTAFATFALLNIIAAVAITQLLVCTSTVSRSVFLAWTFTATIVTLVKIENGAGGPWQAVAVGIICLSALISTWRIFR